MKPVIYTGDVTRAPKEPDRRAERREPHTPLGRWLRDVRLAAGLTQDEFAARIGVHRQTVTSYEAGDFAKGLRAAVETIMRKFPNAPAPPTTLDGTPETHGHGAARAAVREQSAQTLKHMNLGTLTSAIAELAARLHVPNPIDDSEFVRDLSVAWVEYEKRFKARR